MLPTAVARALRHCPLKTSGRSAGTITNSASSTRPTSCGIATTGRPRALLVSAIAASSTASPPASAAKFASGDHSRLRAPGISTRNTSPSSSTARLNTSVAAERSAMNSGRPAWRNRCSYSMDRSASVAPTHRQRRVRSGGAVTAAFRRVFGWFNLREWSPT